MNGSQPQTARIAAIRHLTDDTALFTLQLAERPTEHQPSPAHFQPGQFLQLSVAGAGEAPISYCGFPANDGSIELCIRKAGRVTAALHAAAQGDLVAVRGPFGHGFPLSHYAGQDLLLMAGGLGMAPLRSLLLALLHQRQRYGRLTLLYGAKAPEALLFRHELADLANRKDLLLRLAVDRAGACPPGLSDCRVALLPALLEGLTLAPQRTVIALCGPPAAYRFLVPPLLERGIAADRIHLSLERRMHCGVGHCGHCAVGTLLCCTDGPVFAYSALQTIEGAL
jgi:NAD(P)H-flavin reductase